jgi:hypothetical protein
MEEDGSRMKLRLVVTAVALAAVIGGAAPASATAATRCAGAGSTTILGSTTLRLYYDAAGVPYGCWRATARRTRLDRGVAPNYVGFEATVSRVRVSGAIVGYAFIDPSVPAAYVRSVDLRTGRLLRRVVVTPEISETPDQVAILRLVVSGTGGVAWIQRLDGALSVRRADRRGVRTLDGHDGVSSVQLTLSPAGTLTWRRDGKPRRSSVR